MDGYVVVTIAGGDIVHIPRRIKSYEYVQVIGSGTFGVVILLHDQIRDEKVACKVMKRPNSNCEEIMAIERELRLGGTISCPYLVQCHDVLYLEKIICIIMEYVEGDTLINILQRDAAVLRTNWEKLFWQLSVAIQYLHRKGLAHRDVKLDNVIVDGDFNIKLCDYGAMCEAVGVNTTMCGTVPYMAPEVITGTRYCAKRTDIWSLGICLYTILTGTFPWTKSGMTGMCKEIVEGYIDIVGLPKDARTIVLGCCDVRPERRMTIDEVLAVPGIKMIGGKLTPKQKWAAVVRVAPLLWHVKSDRRSNGNVGVRMNLPKQGLFGPRRMSVAALQANERRPVINTRAARLI